MTAYKATWKYPIKIEEAEVQKVTSHYIFRTGGRREAIISWNSKWFTDRTEAKNFIVSQIEKQMDSTRHHLENLASNLKDALAL